MSEMNYPENKQPQTIENYLEEQRGYLQDAVAAVTGDSTMSAIDVFPTPTPVRQDAEPIEMSAEEEAKLRAAASELGMGAAEDTLSSADHQIIEGGLAWKIAAEARISNPKSTMIFSGSPLRKINEAEDKFMTEFLSPTIKVGEFWDVGETEYDIARQIAEAQAGFEPFEQDVVLPFGYDVAPGAATNEESTGQLIQIGENKGRAVVLLRVDQDNPEPPFFRPDSADLMSVIADVLTATGDEESSVGIVTTNTYPSRGIDAMVAGINHPNRPFDLGMVGRETMGIVKGEEPQPTPANQIPGELHKIADKLAKLESEIQ